MSAATTTPETLADVVCQLGGIALSRIRMHPAPGTATLSDIDAIRNVEKRLFELVDGILVEKAMGFRESLIAAILARVLGNHVATESLGLVVGADGMMRLSDKTVRIPDVAFIAWDHLPGRKVPQEAIPDLAPSLAIEVLSASNTAAEMSRKRKEYFDAGTLVVWEVDIDQRCVNVYSSPESCERLTDQQALSGGRVLPGFKIELSDVFAVLDHRES